VVYIAQVFGAIRRLGTDGIITTIAGLPNVILIGAGAPASTGDGAPAVSAGIKEILGLALDGANNLYVSDCLVAAFGALTYRLALSNNYAGSIGVCATGADGPVAATSFNVPRSLLMGFSRPPAGGRSQSPPAHRSGCRGPSPPSPATGRRVLLEAAAGRSGADRDRPGGLAQDSAGIFNFADHSTPGARDRLPTGNLQTIAGTTCDTPEITGRPVPRNWTLRALAGGRGG